MKFASQSIRLLIFMMVLFGVAYPLAMTGISKLLFPKQANGEFLSRGGQIVGATLIGQNFERPEYFWPRPSAVGHNPQPSGGSNQSQAGEALKKASDERRAKIRASMPENTKEIPQDLLYASASGLDPHISPEAAKFQIDRVAKARNMSVDAVAKWIDAATEGRQLGILGEPVVNVLLVNLALDKAQGIESAPIFNGPTTK